MLTNILQSIGRTPVLRLNALGADLPGTVWLKLENRNPGGSIKDRVAFHVIDKTMEWGDIEAGGTIVEATSGNLGIGIALVAAVRGLHCVLTMPDSMSVERRNLLRALGAELVLTPAAEGMKGAINVAEKLAEERNGLLFGQFSNPLAVEAHYLTTGPEILADSVGHMDVLVAGVERLRIVAAPYIIFGLADVLTGAIRGCGSPVLPVVINLLCTCALRLAWIALIDTSTMPARMVYLSYPFSWLALLVVLLICWVHLYRRRIRPNLVCRQAAA